MNHISKFHLNFIRYVQLTLKPFPYYIAFFNNIFNLALLEYYGKSITLKHV